MNSLLVLTLMLLPSGDDLYVGAAMVEITPPVGYRMAGGYNEVISRGVHDPLYAKAIAWRQGETEAVLVVCDLCSMGREQSDPIRQRVSERTGIPVSHVVISATHTHGGPEYYGPLRDIGHQVSIDQTGHDPHEAIDYLELLVDRIETAVATARERAIPVAVEVVVPRGPGIAFNRRFHMRDGSVVCNPGKKNPEIVRPAGPVDEEFPGLLFRDLATHQPGSSLSVFPMHVATFSADSSFGADFPGVLQERLVERYGTGFVSVFGEGTAGDTNHVNVDSAEPEDGRTERTRIGNALAEAFIRGEDKLQSAGPPKLTVASARVPIPLIEVTEAELLSAQNLMQKSVVGHESTEFLTAVAAWRALNTKTLRARGDANLQDEVQVIRLSDDVAIVTLPHEVFVELGMAIKQQSPFKHTLVISLANDIDFYVPTLKAFGEGSYEVTTSSYKPGGGELLVEGAVQLLKDVHSR